MFHPIVGRVLGKKNDDLLIADRFDNFCIDTFSPTNSKTWEKEIDIILALQWIFNGYQLSQQDKWEHDDLLQIPL
jgi:hypothetical protein